MSRSTVKWLRCMEFGRGRCPGAPWVAALVPWCLGALVPWCPPSWHRHVSTGRAGRSRSRSTILGRPRSNSGAWEACDATVSPTKSTRSFSIFALLLLGRGRKWTQDIFPYNHILIMHKNLFLNTWSIAVNVTYESGSQGRGSHMKRDVLRFVNCSGRIFSLT